MIGRVKKLPYLVATDIVDSGKSTNRLGLGFLSSCRQKYLLVGFIKLGRWRYPFSGCEIPPVHFSEQVLVTEERR
jgi:hypothetical protein